jgi:N utilization substance protein A
MPKEERVPNERLNPNQRLTFLLKEINETAKGKQLLLSRSDPVFVQKLFEREVPEMSSGSVEVMAISREPGVRTKMAVDSNQSGVDPVGSCVGQKGVRVQAVTNELGGERVDIIPWNDDPAELIKAALAPADGLSVSLDKKEKTAKVKAPEDQLSLAIGKDGQNARLAAKLTGWKIEVKDLDGNLEGVPDEDEKKEDNSQQIDKEKEASNEEEDSSKKQESEVSDIKDSKDKEDKEKKKEEDKENES